MATADGSPSRPGDRPAPERRLARAAHWARRIGADPQLQLVLLVWAGCCLAFVIYLKRFQNPLPWADEWDLTPAATGEAPLTWQWLWTPANQHRAPLVRLQVLLLGRLSGWDMRLGHYVNLVLLALSSLALTLAVRAARGRSIFADAFISLVMLAPAQFESIMVFSYSYALALSCFALALAAVTTGWPLRSATRLTFYLVLLTAVALSGGPAGNCWALGLCGVVLRGWRAGAPRLGRWVALGGTTAVAALSGMMLATIPHVQGHDHLVSDSVRTTLHAASKVAMVWMGHWTLADLWPWAALAFWLPLGYVAACSIRAWVRDRGHSPETRDGLATWTDLGPVLFAGGAVALLIGYARGKYPGLWDSRYGVLLAPLPLTLYLLLVRLRLSPVLPAALAFWMVLCAGWTWPAAIAWGRAWGGPRELAYVLRQAEQPLAAVTARYAPAIGCTWGDTVLLTDLLHLRRAGLSVFHPRRLKEAVPGMGPALLWKAETGRLIGKPTVVPDAQATYGTALEFNGADAAVAYDFEVPGGGCYLLCCRLRAPDEGELLEVCVDGGPPVTQALPPGPAYAPQCLDPLLALPPGRHTLTLSLPGPGARLDLVELVPRSRELPPTGTSGRVADAGHSSDEKPAPAKSPEGSPHAHVE